MNVYIVVLMVAVVVGSCLVWAIRSKEDADEQTDTITPAYVKATTVASRSPDRYAQTPEDVEFERNVLQAINMEIDATFYTKVSGTSFLNDDGTSRIEVIGRCKKYQSVKLHWQRDSPHSPRSVAVYVDEGQLGHLPSRVADEVVRDIKRHGDSRYLAVFRRATRRETTGHVAGAVLFIVCVSRDQK